MAAQHSDSVIAFVEQLKREHLIYHDPTFVKRVYELTDQFEAEAKSSVAPAETPETPDAA